jgi:hypothetical protein
MLNLFRGLDIANDLCGLQNIDHHLAYMDLFLLAYKHACWRPSFEGQNSPQGSCIDSWPKIDVFVQWEHRYVQPVPTLHQGTRVLLCYGNMTVVNISE